MIPREASIVYLEWVTLKTIDNNNKVASFKKNSWLMESFVKIWSFKEVVCAKAAKKYQKAREKKNKTKKKQEF